MLPTSSSNENLSTLLANLNLSPTMFGYLDSSKLQIQQQQNIKKEVFKSNWKQQPQCINCGKTASKILNDKELKTQTCLLCNYLLKINER